MTVPVLGVGSPPLPHLTMCLLLESMRRRDTSRRAVEGTPSSSIYSTPKVCLNAKEIITIVLNKNRSACRSDLETCLLQGHQLVGCPILGLVDLPIRPFSDLLKLNIIVLRATETEEEMVGTGCSVEGCATGGSHTGGQLYHLGG